MFNLEKITVAKLWALEDETLFNSYLELQKVLNPVPVFCGLKAKALGSLEFGQVANLKEYISNPTPAGILDAFKIVFGVKEKTYLAADVVSYFYALNWITEEMQKLVDLEAKMLADKPDPLMDMAGAKALDMFRELPVLDMLAQRYSQPPQIVETWSYNFVFGILLMIKKTAEVRTEYNRLEKLSKPIK